MGGIRPDKPAASCAECLCWGVLPGTCCRSCYTFRNLHLSGRCDACRRIVPVKDGYCRLCRAQALSDAKAAGKTAVSEPFLRAVRCQQLFFARMHRDHYRIPGRIRLGKAGTPRHRTSRPEPATTYALGQQLCLPFDFRHDYSRFDRYAHADPTDPIVIQARCAAGEFGEARGWSRWLIKKVREGLTIVLSHRVPGEKVRYSELATIVRHCGRVAEILDHLALLDDDRVPAFDSWLDRKLDSVTPGIRREVENWIRALHHGGHRTRRRDPHTGRAYLNDIRPALLDWSSRYDNLREVTRDDILNVANALRGNRRRHTLIALRSLFAFAKKTGIVFRDPTARIPVGPNTYSILQPLPRAAITEAANAATTPAARLTLALAAIHAARTTDIGRLKLDDIDLGNRKLTIAGRARPLDDLTHRALTEWLTYRHTHWPGTANPHVLINRVTAVRDIPVGRVWITKAFWGLTATLDRLHIDRQLEESLTHGPDPLHLTAVFGISPGTAIRYAAAARQLLTTPAELHQAP
ncbi:hypothetical protein OG563_33425 [Nocardia vinacea]|uniref:Core-binding (CB) domain-containing protein n=1 Tax=Nocardia vinacea TaxID=96468 RepID=A0ABZ1YM38_9NOCA|nr:hypothetical protein [Nocardia vinacea]